MQDAPDVLHMMNMLDIAKMYLTPRTFIAESHLLMEVALCAQFQEGANENLFFCLI